MKASGLRACALFAGCIAIAACSQTTEVSRFLFTPSSGSAIDRGVAPPSYRVLHDFGAGQDGMAANALISVGDTFYGTTAAGGANDCPENPGCGTVFSLTADGKETVLHSFGKGSDGWWPAARLIDVGGTLYGTTTYGGEFNCGTVFSVTPSGKEKVLYSFGRRDDGQNPISDLVDVGGTFYGTTFAGGTGCAVEGCGTVFSLTMAGKEKVLHRFYPIDGGWYPSSGLTYVRGRLYGETFSGGKYGDYEEGWGVVFSITTDGKEVKTLHSFGKGNDGWYPAADLLDVNGTLYGTTEEGGANCGSQGCGIVFSITTSGSEKVLRSFKETDGGYSESSLIDVGGTLYGTTDGGGANDCIHDYDGRCGTVFSVTTAGEERVLHSFRQGSGGNGPITGLIYKNGSLFGTTSRGGRYGGGSGVIFSLKL